MLGLDSKNSRMLVALLSGCLLVVLNLTLLSPALPSIMSDIGVDATTAQWLTSGYSLVEAVVIPLSAYLMGRFSTRKLFMGGLCVFAAGSLLAALAPNFGFLLAGRMLQAVCTGIVMPMTTTLMLLMFPKERRGTAMGIVSLVIGFAPAIGPSVSGLLVDHVGWRALFGIVFVLTIAVIAIAAKWIKNKEGFERTKFDALSVMLSSLGLVSLLYGLSSFSTSNNLGATAALIIVGIALLALFALRQFRLEQPMLRIQILGSHDYRIAVCTIVIIQMSIMGMSVIMPLYIQGVLGHNATISGISMLPGALLGAFAGVVAGKLFDRFGVRKVAIPGFIIVLFGAIGMLTYGVDTSIVFVGTAYTFLSVGMQFAMTAMNTWGVNSLENEVVQHAQSLSNTLNQVAGSFGTALLVSLSALGTSMSSGASTLEQTMSGYHLSICVTAALLFVAFIFVCIFARPNKDTHANRGEKAREKAAEFVAKHPVSMPSPATGNVKASEQS
jgi:EmrB/QacA subfamily drug resistance transporter